MSRRLITVLWIASLTCAAAAQVVSFPFSEDFESFGLGTPGAMRNGWIQAGGDQFSWTVDRAGTSSDTGPSVDHTLGTTSGIYLYAEASNPRVPGDEAFLLSPSLVTSGLASPVVTFWYHMYGSTMGTLSVEVTEDCVTWTPVWSLSGDQGNSWFEANVDLAPYIGATTRIRFKGVTGSSYISDMAIDDISVTVQWP